MLSKFPFYLQHDAMDCGPACLRMISKYYGKSYSIEILREKTFVTREGVSLLGISDAAESIGLHTIGVRTNYEKLTNNVSLPCIAHWQQKHFVVIYRIKKENIFIADPASGLLKYNKREFLDGWMSTKGNGVDEGVLLLVEPTPNFYDIDDERLNRSNFKFLFLYLKPFKKYLIQVILGLLLGSLLQLIIPFLTQSIVDIGIKNQDVNFIYLVLLAQLVLIISSTLVNFIRSWILLHISTRIDISLISDFLIKLMKLPISFFDKKTIGDILQRVNDHLRIESFLTGSTLTVLFSLMNLFVFSIVLAIYSITILGAFWIGSTLYVFWIYIFMKKRRELDYKKFTQLSDNQSSLIQLITGIQEIKLNNCERQKRWEWENIQAKLFRINVRGLSLSQYQQGGAVFINETKNLLITVLAAGAVIRGSISLGMMVAIQYIIGQLNSPIEQMVNFFQSTQDAKISLERLNEIHNKDDEEEAQSDKNKTLPYRRDIIINNLSFRYDGPYSDFVLENLNLIIPQNKVTAIVGTSGSGKTTLIKLLLGFYSPTNGEIKIGDVSLNKISQKYWRNKCGVVLQDGFIFSDTIANNIAVSDEKVNNEKLLRSVTIANIKEYIESLPLGYNTKIGLDGHGLSQGQRQRVLIARAIYKNPEYIFLDEATNALDASNERLIIDSFQQFFRERTVVIVAHRLSTVKNADQIVVLDNGKITEQGNHIELTKLHGTYYNLVKNQLEMGK